MKVPVDFSIVYEGGDYSIQVPYEDIELPCIGAFEMVEVEGRDRLVEITDVKPAVLFAGKVRVPVYGRVVPNEAKPTVRFVDGITMKTIDVVQTRRTDTKYHLLKKGDKVNLYGGGTVVITHESPLSPNEIVFQCR